MVHISDRQFVEHNVHCTFNELTVYIETCQNQLKGNSTAIPTNFTTLHQPTPETIKNYHF